MGTAFRAINPQCTVLARADGLPTNFIVGPARLGRVQQFMTLLDARLEGRKFIAADITAVVAVDFARVVRIKPSEQHVNLRKARGGGIAGLGWGLVTPPLVMGRAPRFSALALLE